MEGGLAIASLSIQLIDSISAIKTFIQHVKDAPKESHRIVDLLERLGDLIEGVRDMTEQQTTLRGHQLPPPSPIIFRCLKSCKTTLEPLKNLVEKYKQSQAHKSSSITKFRGDLAFAWKSKDIIAMETKIQQEIQYLTSTLVLNSTSILFQVPAMFNAHIQVQSQPRVVSTYEEAVEKTSQISISDDMASLERPFETTVATTTTRSSWVPWYFERFGVRQQRLSRILKIAQDGTSSTETSEQVISEQEIYSWASSYWGHGISWTRNRLYGGILPSITTYPIVEIFPMDIFPISVGEFQRDITAGKVHPFARDGSGRSLLHEAALYHRLDICKLLLAYGLQADLSRTGESPFYASLFTWGDFNRIEFFRLFVQEANDFNTLDTMRWFPMSGGPEYNPKMEEASWLWAQSTNWFYGEDLSRFHNILYRQTIYYYIVLLIDSRTREMPTFPDALKTNNLRQWLETGDMGVLSRLFENGIDPTECFWIGRKFLDFLDELGVDVYECITAEMRLLPDGCFIKSWEYGTRTMRVVFDSSDKSDPKGWKLGWECVIAPEDSGYLLFNEYTNLALQNGNAYWPYAYQAASTGWQIDSYLEAERKKSARFNRRLEKKARKERAFLGIKQPKSRMPGSWS